MCVIYVVSGYGFSSGGSKQTNYFLVSLTDFGFTAPLLRMNLLQVFQIIPVKLVLNVAVSRSSLHKNTITVVAGLFPHRSGPGHFLRGVLFSQTS